MTLTLDNKGLTLTQVRLFLEERPQIAVSAQVRARLTRVRAFVERKLATHTPFYGINTGFGMMANKRISDNDLERLQENLILSHAVGVGEAFDEATARLIMLLRAAQLALGYSGICPETLDLLVACLNCGITPVIPCQGSVSASGDLAPLAHSALTLIGRGEVFYEGRRMSSAKALKKAGLTPVTLKPKEGIALINGTQATAAVAVIVMITAERILKCADIAGALSVEGDRASQRPFDPRIQRVRPHPGQIATARNVRKLIAGSRIIADHAACTRVQDPYSFRCIPQVHGASKDMYRAARATLDIELKSSTDNPLLFDEDDEILSGGNFHAQPLGLMMDAMAVALAELGSIAERRVAILCAPLSGELPIKFLVKDPGLNSGFIIPHVTVAALVSENKALAHPASVDSVPTSGGQEDHVSMGLIAARKALAIARNVEVILALELLAACQAIDLGSPGKRAGKGTHAVYTAIRSVVPLIEHDREFQIDIASAIELVRSGQVVRVAEQSVGSLII